MAALRDLPRQAREQRGMVQRMGGKNLTRLETSQIALRIYGFDFAFNAHPETLSDPAVA
jgi:hypothetical protein